MRHSLYKYFTERKWAEAFLDGAVLFRSLAYFHDYEDQNVRSDRNEGTAIYRPQDGLVIHNQTQEKTFRWADSAFEATANQEEILAYCASRTPPQPHAQGSRFAVMIVPPFFVFSVFPSTVGSGINTISPREKS